MSQPLPGEETTPTDNELEADSESFMGAMAALGKV